MTDFEDWFSQENTTTTTATNNQPSPPPTPVETAPSPSTDDFSKWFEDKSSNPTLPSSIHYGSQINPDTAAKILKIKDQTELSSDFVSRNLPTLEAKQNVATIDANDIQNKAPNVAQWLSEDPHHVAVASNDIPILSSLERQFSYMGNQLERGVFDVERSALGFKAFTGFGSAEDETRIASIEKKLGTDLNVPAPGKVSNVFGKFVEGVPQLAGVLGAGALASLASVPATAIAATSFATMEAGNAYLDYRRRKDQEGNPISDAEARGWATVSGVLNGAAVLVPMGKIMEQVPGLRMLGKGGIDSILSNPTARQAFQTYIKGIGESSLAIGGFSGFGTLVHNAAGKLAEFQNAKASYSPMEILSSIFSKENLKEAVESAGIGIVTGGLLGAALGAPRMFNEYRNAMQTQESWQNIGEMVKNAQMAKNAPEQLEKVISRIAPDQNVFIPMDKWQSYWESQKVDPRTAFREVAGQTNAYDESIRTGADLQIPAAKYATTIAPSEHGPAFLSSLRSSPDVFNAEEVEQGKQFHAEQTKAQESLRTEGTIPTSEEFVKGLKPEEQSAIEKGRQAIQGTPTKAQFATPEGDYTPERQELHKQIVQSFEKPEAVAPEGTKPKAVIVIGPPGSGKSTILKNLPENFVQIDNDIIKEKLPDFEPNKAALYHHESSDIQQQVVNNTINKRMNFALPIIGKTTEALLNQVRDLKAANYDVDLIHMKMDPEQAAQSAFQRYMKGGRFVDPKYVLEDVGLKTEETYARLKSEVSQYAQYQSATEEGKSPTLLETNERLGSREVRNGPSIGGNQGSSRSVSGQTASQPESSVGLPTPQESKAFFTKNTADKSLIAAQIEQGTSPLFDDPKAVGMSPEKQARYQKALLAAQESASKQMADQIRTEQDRIQNADRRSLRTEIEADVNSQKEYRAIDTLKAATGLNRAAIEKDFPTFDPSRLPRGTVEKEGGNHPDFAADMLGYRSGSELLFNIETAPDREQLIKERIEERIQEKYGDPNEQEHLRQEAFKAIHNEQRSRLLQLELEHLASNDFATFKGIAQTITRKIPRLEEIQSQASDMIGQKLAGDTKPFLYQRAESQAGQEARDLLFKGDINKAFEAKNRELLNHELFREAQNAIEQNQKDIAFTSKFDSNNVRAKLGKAGSDYLEQIDAIREKFDFAPASGKEVQRKQSLRDFIDTQKKAGYDPDIPPELLNETYRKSYREMTNDELHSIVDAMRNIDHLATLKTKLLKVQSGRDFDEVRTEVTDSMKRIFDLEPKNLDKPIDLHPSLADKIGKKLENFSAWRTKMEFLFRFLDGGEYHGPSWETFFSPLNEAENFKTERMRDAYDKINDIFSGYSKMERAGFHHDLTYIPEIGMNMNKLEMMMTLLHSMNEGNQSELLRGYKWNESQLQAVWKHLDTRDVQTSQKIVDFINSYWPEISKQERALNGLVPEKIEGRPLGVTVKDGSTVHVEGGYFPLVYDKNISWRAAALGEGETIKDLFSTQAGRAATKHGWTNERVGGGGMAPSLNMSTFINHVGDVIHDLAYREPVTDLYKLINDSDIKNHIEAAAGKELYRQLNPWLKRIAGDRPWNPLGPLAALNTVRSNMTVAELGLKFTSAAIHSTSFLTASRELGPKYSVLGLKDSANILSAWDFVREKSEFMKSRPDNFDRDIRSAGHDLNIAGVDDSWLSKMKAMSPIQRSSFWALMRGFDLGVAIPTWMGAYRKAMEGGVKNIESGNESDAIDYADQLVRDTKGSGAAKDLAPIQSAGGQLGKLFTMFYTQLNVIDNQFMEAHREFKLDRNIPKLMTTASMVWFLQAPLTELIRGRTPNTDEGWGKWLAKSELLYPMAMIPGLREAVSYWQRGDLQSSPVFESIKSMLKTVKDVSQITPGLKDLVGEKEWTDKEYSDAFMSAGYATGLPTRQAFRSSQYLYDWMTGAEQPDNPMEGLYRTLVGKKSQK